MSDIEKIKTIIDLQIGFNNSLSGERWKTSPPAYLDAIWTEATEAYNHTNWEWWKNINKEIDYGQIKMELIDILHFLVSETLVSTREKESESLSKVLHDGYNQVIKAHAGNETDKEPSDLKYALRAFIHMATSADKHPEDVAFILWSGFFTFMYLLDMTWAEVYKLYVGKNLLNTFRQNNGYKKDTDRYKTRWAAVEGKGWEDNQFLTQLLEEVDLDKPVAELQEDILSVLTSKFEVTQ